MQRLVVVLHVFVGLGGALVVIKCHTGRNHVEHDRAAVGDGRLHHGCQLLFVTGEGASHKGSAQLNGQHAGVNGGQVVDDPGLQLGADVGGGRELALGQAVHAVIFDDVDDGQVPPHQVNELAHADGSGIAVATDPQSQQVAVSQHSSSGHRGHAPVHRVEAVGAIHEISRAFGGAANAAQLGQALRLNPHFIHRFQNA